MKKLNSNDSLAWLGIKIIIPFVLIAVICFISYEIWAFTNSSITPDIFISKSSAFAYVILVVMTIASGIIWGIGSSMGYWDVNGNLKTLIPAIEIPFILMFFFNIILVGDFCYQIIMVEELSENMKNYGIAILVLFLLLGIFNAFRFIVDNSLKDIFREDYDKTKAAASMKYMRKCLQ